MSTKICMKCGEEKELECFYTAKQNKDGLMGRCKACVVEYSKRYNRENPEKALEYQKQWEEANPERRATINKLYREANVEKLAASRKLRDEANPEKCNIIKQRRRARKKELPCTLTIAQWNTAKEYFNNQCAYCGEDKPLAQEHFIALSEGGEYTLNNIIPSCKSCNSSKSTKDFFKWYPTHNSYSEMREQTILKYLGYIKELQQLKMSV